MKNLIVILVAVVFSLVSVQNTYAEKEKPNNKKEVKLSCEMKCQACADKVTKQLSFTKGVRAVEADFEKDIVTVVYNSEKTSPEKLITSLEKINYTASVAKTGCCKGSDVGCCKGKQTTGETKPACGQHQNSGCAGKTSTGEGAPAGCGSKTHSGCAGKQTTGESKPAGCGGH
ncbi:MAG TPA: heavy-metal-associated domain-containing protein [Bacteroidales bacterium]|nr:heavy-metal-associated domain-containing protein [Bacteroidales bacterium]